MTALATAESEPYTSPAYSNPCYYTNGARSVGGKANVEVMWVTNLAQPRSARNHHETRRAGMLPDRARFVVGYRPSKRVASS